MEMVVLIAIVCATEAYIAKMIYRLSGKAVYDENKQKQVKACITGLQFIAIMVVLIAMIIAALSSGYIQ